MAVPVILNGDFEAPSRTGVNVNQPPGSWDAVIDLGDIGHVGADFDGTSDGQWVFLNVGGILAQTFGADAGDYILQFTAKSSAGSDSIVVRIDGAPVQTIALTGSWATYETDPITLASGSRTLSFAHSAGSGYVGVDDVSWMSAAIPPVGRLCAFDGTAGLAF